METSIHAMAPPFIIFICCCWLSLPDIAGGELLGSAPMASRSFLAQSQLPAGVGSGAPSVVPEIDAQNRFVEASTATGGIAADTNAATVISSVPPSDDSLTSDRPQQDERSLVGGSEIDRFVEAVTGTLSSAADTNAATVMPSIPPVEDSLTSDRPQQDERTLMGESEVVGEAIPREFNHEHSLNFVLVVPKYKLLFCYIPKNACSDFNSLFNEINGIAPATEAGPWFGSSAVRHFGWTEEQVNSALHSEQWYKAAFLRDPLERVLSAYLSKCVPNADGNFEDEGQHCIGYESTVRTNGAPPFVDFLENLKKRSQEQKGVVDAHFAHQSDFCGGLSASDYDFVGSFDEELNPQVKNLLETIGASAFEPLADKYFRTRDPETADENQLTKASTPTVFNIYFNKPDLFLQGFDLYERDYKNLPVLRQRHRANRICATCLYALDFEKKRSLDWIAYHNLMGVNCFLLFIDRTRSNMEDPEVKKVYDHLMASPMVTLLDTETEEDRIPPVSVMKKLATLLGIRYLMPIDGDEFVVLEDDRLLSEAEAQQHDSMEQSDILLQRRLLNSGFQDEFSANREVQSTSNLAAPVTPMTASRMISPPSLRLYLESHVNSAGALGVYMHRWDYGTSGYVQAPSLVASPEFAVLSERVGNNERDHHADRHGKVILNMASGTEFVGEHMWTVPKTGGDMLLPNGSAFACSPKCVCGPSCQDDNRNDDLDCDFLCKPSSPQKLFINHYTTGSLEDCFEKSRRSVYTKGSYYECNKLHPGTTEYKAMALSHGFTRDNVLEKYAAAVRVRRVELFLPTSFSLQR